MPEERVVDCNVSLLAVDWRAKDVLARNSEP